MWRSLVVCGSSHPCCLVSYKGVAKYHASAIRCAQVQAPYYNKWQDHDGDGLRIKDVQGNATTYYLRSTVLGGNVVAEINPSGTWMRGYVYAGEQLVAVQSGGNYFVHQDPITKSQRITDASGNVVEAIELDPFGGETNRSTSPT